MQKLNYWYLAAAMLCLFMMGMQIFVGSPQLNAPIQQSSLPPGIRAVAEVAWHSVTTAYGLMVAALIYLFIQPNNVALAKYIVAQLVALSALFERLPELELDDPITPEWKRTITLRGVTRLPAHW